MIEIHNVSKSFGGNVVLKDVNLTLDHGDVVAILGPSGSGKTTFLRSLNFLERADTGTFSLGGVRRTTCTTRRRRRFWRCGARPRSCSRTTICSPT